MIRLLDVRKVYAQGGNRIVALDGVSLDIHKGEFVTIMGPSGSGKSTLLHLIGGLDRPTEGEVLVDGRIISQMADDHVTLFRRTQIGFVFQFFNLLPTLSALENVVLPMILDGKSRGDARERGRALLGRVGLEGRSGHLPEELSGGEIQRVAIARALIFSPPILLADEPTGNLDSKNGDAVLGLLREINQDEKCTVVMATHNLQAARYGGRLLHLRDGMLVEENA
jgi:putative ABC transport system ATP-binding protein